MIKKRRKPEKVSNVLNNILKKLGYSDVVTFSLISSNWENIVGKAVYKNTECKKFENKILYVTVKSSTWKNEIIYMKGSIIKKIRDIAEIDDILFY